MSIPMSDSVLAAIIAGTATLSASLLQLRSALLRNASRGVSAGRRKGRLQMIILAVVVGAAAIAGFALSQWLTSGERLAPDVHLRRRADVALVVGSSGLALAAKEIGLPVVSDRAAVQANREP